MRNDWFRLALAFIIFAIIIMFVCGIIGFILSVFWFCIKIGFWFILGTIVASIIWKIFEYFFD